MRALLLAVGPALCRAYPGFTPRVLDQMTLREIGRYLEFFQESTQR